MNKKIAIYCPVCHQEIEEGEEARCKFCSETVHEEYCMRWCWVCLKKMCKWCINKKDYNKEWICEACLDYRDYVEKLVIEGINIQGYNYSGREQTDDDVILKYSSSEHLPVEVHIKKVRD